VTCTGIFTGTAKDLVVPSSQVCTLSGATITHDVTVQPDASLGAGAGTTIGHDLIATKPAELVAGYFGSLRVGHDLKISGTDATPSFPRVYAVCNTTIVHDLRITGTTADLIGLSVVDVADVLCSFYDPGAEPDSVGHDAVVTGNSAPNIDVGKVS
jgi:hypothetical protein